VILHGSLGHWISQLRPRLHDQPARWIETRSTADLEAALTNLAFPIVVVDLTRHASSFLRDLVLVSRLAPDARVLVLDPDAQPDVRQLARELGATHVFSGFVPPPEVAGFLARWIALARKDLERAGWAPPAPSASARDPWDWLSEHLGETPAWDLTPAARRTRSGRVTPAKGAPAAQPPSPSGSDAQIPS
jgi:hypothetical protein